MTESTVIRGERASARSRRPIRDGGRPQRPIAAADREYALFAAMVAVVALHVADDSFLQPQPGTSAGDHLVSGFVPLAALALAVAGYPRLRGGGRAAIPNPYAWNEGEHDLIAAIDFLKQRPDVDPGRIGGLGLSVGGETFLQTAAHSKDVQAVVSEGASSRSVGELLSVPGSQWGPVTINAVITAGTAVFSDAAPPPHLIDLVAQIAPRSMFLIYATDGTGGEEHTVNRALHRAAGEPKAIWEVPEAGHVGAQEARPREYEQRVTHFFDHALRKEQR